MGNLNNELAKERSRAAPSARMMAWIRTSLLADQPRLRPRQDRRRHQRQSGF